MSTLLIEKNGVLPLAQEHKLNLLYAGVHPQEDRDARLAAKTVGGGKKLWNMIRLRVPNGSLTADQYLALNELAERATYNRSLRITAGQSIQLHGVRDEDLHSTLSQIEKIGLAAGCHSAGFEFAVAVSPVPLQTEAYRQLRALSGAICDEYYPKPGRSEVAHPEHQPRKFAIGLSLIEDHTGNVFANDVGLLVMKSPDGKTKVNVFAGGSLSMPGRRADTYARLATLLGSVEIDQVIPTLKAITRVFSAHGELATRRHTRLKYVVDKLGADRFRREVEAELGFALEQPIPFGELKTPSWLGAHEQGNGEMFYGLGVPFGRIQDAGFKRYKSAIAMIVEALHPGIILAPDQNILFSHLRREQIIGLEKILSAYHIPFGNNLSKLRFEAMACAGLPTCPLAVAESERVAGPILDELEAELFRIGKNGSSFSFRISGCSIGCIRPNMVDLGAIGRKPGHYDLFIGGSETVGRFGELYAETIPLAQIVPTIKTVLEFWGQHSGANESFSDFYTRYFGTREKPTRLVFSESIAARERVEKAIEDFRKPAGESILFGNGIQGSP